MDCTSLYIYRYTLYTPVSYDLVAWQIFEVHSRRGTCVSNENHLPAPVVDRARGTGLPAITQEIFKCLSSVAGVGLSFARPRKPGQSNIGK